MTTYTDSYLEGHHIREVFAIVEVKAAHRDRKTRPEILRQEAAQMVAWIMNDANSRQCPLGQRLMISQDKEEIYSTLASYPQEYLEHILGGEALRSRFSP